VTSTLERLVRTPAAAVEFANVLLTQGDALVGSTPRDVVWSHRATTLYRYRSSQRRHPVPLLLVFALINRPDIFDLRHGNSFVEYLLSEGFDVFLVDWGVPGEEDDDMGLDTYVCDELNWAVRETLHEAGAEELSLLGWCIGGTLSAMYTALHADAPVRNLALLTTPIDTTGSLYKRWVDPLDADLVADSIPVVPGQMVDFANKMMKPVTNFVTTYRKLYEGVVDHSVKKESWQAMAKWVADNPPFPGAAYRQWIRGMYQENRLVKGTMYLRGRRVDLGQIDQNLLVVTAGADHIAPPAGTAPIFDAVTSADVTHIDRPGGHIGLMAGSKAREEIWPDIAEWLAERSQQ
jgi:poly[(R)-3-hydroxyalkanoate] polymerase subunit PhaC